MLEKPDAPVVLCILDGWGSSGSQNGDAIAETATPFFDELNRKFPPTFINASAGYVGLPDGQMGNSEVGHLNIGAGRVVLQELPKVNQCIDDGSFFENSVIDAAMRQAVACGNQFHLVGLLSDGGVHSHINHIKAFLKKASQVGLSKLYLHPMMDGRDTPPNSGKKYMQQLISIIDEVGTGKIATVQGRYYGMDRDNRWERVSLGFNAMVHGIGKKHSSPLAAVEASYAEGISDEFIKPVVITDSAGSPIGQMADGDVVMMFNFRADRVRQITAALHESTFAEFDRGDMPNLKVNCMTQYSEAFNLPVAFNSHVPRNGIGEYLANLGLRQFRTAETEKYPHVTFFFNGGREKLYKGEDRRLVASPKVATYDLQPEMSAYDVLGGLMAAIKSGEYHLLVVNFANGDMVGHTGIWDAAAKAVKVIDDCVSQLSAAVIEAGGSMIVTADHGNIEQMFESDGSPKTSHSTNPVPLYIIGKEVLPLKTGGALCDVAPTLLQLLGLPQPDEMTGHSLIEGSNG